MLAPSVRLRPNISANRVRALFFSFPEKGKCTNVAYTNGSADFARKLAASYAKLNPHALKKARTDKYRKKSERNDAKCCGTAKTYPPVV